jgi:RNA polymerase sigma factor (sigma-70 family)
MSMTDNELLAEFARSGSQDAFRELAGRYSGMVLATCRRRLGDSHQAEDVAQAVFLALARKASRIRPGKLAAWLHRAAELGSLRVLRDRSLRKRREREAAEMVSENDTAKAWEEVRPVLDEAVAGLPARYREVIVMHYLGGRKVADVSAELGKPVGTVCSLLSRGVEKLRAALERRGVSAMPAAALAGVLAANSSGAPVSAALVDSIVGTALAEVPASSVLAISETIFSGMFWAKAKSVAAAVCIAVLAGTAGTVGATHLVSLSGGPRPGASPFYAEMADRSWKLAGGKAGPPFRAGMLHASGGALDSAGRRLLVFGGGSTAHAGNEVWSWSIDTRRWKRLYAPDRLLIPRDEARGHVDNAGRPGMWLPSGRPIARSSYSSLEFIPEKGFMIAGGEYTVSGRDNQYWKTGGRPEGVWPRDPMDFWSFDPETLKWTYRGSARRKPNPGPMPRSITAAVYVPDAKTVIAVDRSHATWSYDVEEGSWSRRSGGGYGYHSCLAYDSRRRRVYCTAKAPRAGGGNKLVLKTYDPAGDRWSPLELSGEEPRTGDNGEGIAYDTRNDVLVTFGNDGLWAVDLEEECWLKNPGNPKPAPRRQGGVFNRLRYDPVNNVTFYVGEEVWAYRYAGGR